MSFEHVPTERFRFYVFTCRDPRTDFRLPLVDALRRHYETWYIWLRRRPVVSGPGLGSASVEMSLPGFLRFIRQIPREGAVNVYFNSTNTYFPGMTLILRLVAAAGVWCFDMHDDLRYHNTGLKRWREGVIVAALCRLSHVVVHAAPTLRELFPRSKHLGNASSLVSLGQAATQGDRVLVIASFDERFDFDFLSDLALICPDTQIDLHGWTRPNDVETARKIGAIVSRHANVHYFGGYTMHDLPAILASYHISVAPYRTNTAITRYIDPLRFYHCLNAGLEMISTDIPQARYLEAAIHVASNPAECARLLTEIKAGRLAKQPHYAPITWEQRAAQLTHIVRALPRTFRLQGKRTPGVEVHSFEPEDRSGQGL